MSEVACAYGATLLCIPSFWKLISPAMNKRFVRLKEREPLSSGVLAPSANYAKFCDSSLVIADYPWSVDRNGFLDTGNKFSFRSKIAFVGDSFVESLFAMPLHRFVSQVERNLNDAGLKVQLLNSGCSFSTTLHLVNVVINKIYPVVGQGGEVFLFMPVGEFPHILAKGGYWNSLEEYSPVTAMSKNLGVLPSVTAAARGLLLTLLQFCKSFSVKITLVIPPMRNCDFKGDVWVRGIFGESCSDFEVYMRAYGESRRVWCDIAASRGVAIVDLSAHLGGDPIYFYDMVHLNAKGHEVVARKMTEHILANVYGLGCQDAVA